MVNKKTTISGPGAADFLTAEGGVDFPETDASTGMKQTRDGNLVGSADELEPQLEAPDHDREREKPATPGAIPPGRDERRSE